MKKAGSIAKAETTAPQQWGIRYNGAMLDLVNRFQDRGDQNAQFFLRQMLTPLVKLVALHWTLATEGARLLEGAFVSAFIEADVVAEQREVMMGGSKGGLAE